MRANNCLSEFHDTLVPGQLLVCCPYFVSECGKRGEMTTYPLYKREHIRFETLRIHMLFPTSTDHIRRREKGHGFYLCPNPLYYTIKDTSQHWDDHNIEHAQWHSSQCWPPLWHRGASLHRWCFYFSPTVSKIKQKHFSFLVKMQTSSYSLHLRGFFLKAAS